MLKVRVFFKNCKMGIMCNKWPLDGSRKTFHGTVAWRAGTLEACLAYPSRDYEQSVLLWFRYTHINQRMVRWIPS